MKNQLQDWIDQSHYIVFFGGAGVSTESGVPDFRSVNGLYHQKYDVAPEQILSHSYFVQHTEAFFRFYRDKMLLLDAAPNAAHKKLVQLEQAGKLKAVITQNIDGLHQKAGSQNVFELHGSIHRNYCMRCHKSYSAEDIVKSERIPLCACGGIIKPDVILYGEPLNQQILEQSIVAISQADLMIVGGTSLNVYPAAGLLRYFAGKYLVIINRDSTPADNSADLLIQGKIGEVLSEIDVSGCK